MQKDLKKKRTLREREEFPYLKKNLNTKRRQNYVDNIDYINGAYDDTGKKVIRALNEQELAFLNQFNKEYYSASFDKDDSKNLFKNKVDDKTIESVRYEISSLREKINSAFNASKVSNYQEKFSGKLHDMVSELDVLVKHLEDIYPKKQCTDANNARNRCLLNSHLLSEDIDIVSIDNGSLNSYRDVDIEFLYTLNGMELDYSNDEEMEAVYEVIANYLDKT